jgi:predicted polyphosphate/ATP-dependent NAD kinase
MGTVGVIANPAAGKDIRRLVAHASPTSDAAKMGVVRRAVLGAIDAGATRILVAPDRHNLSTRAVEGLELSTSLAGVTIDVLDEPAYGWSGDTVTMATRMAKDGVDAVLVLGGDGTQRDVAKGWLDLPLVAISTGTNNVFPRSIDATLAGLAAGLVAAGVVPLGEVSYRAKVAHVSYDDGSNDDLAMVDLGLMDGQFTGSRAVWDPHSLRTLIACIAEPASVGLSSIAGLLMPVDRRSAGGVHVQLGGPNRMRAPLAPGMFSDIAYSSVRALMIGQPVMLHGPGVLSFDGERDKVLADGATATVHIRPDGPHVIDVEAAIAAAAHIRHFHRPGVS